MNWWISSHKTDWLNRLSTPHLSLMMTSAQVVEMLVAVMCKSPCQTYSHRMIRCHFLWALWSQRWINSIQLLSRQLWQTIIIMKIRGETVLYGYKFSIQYLFWVCELSLMKGILMETKKRAYIKRCCEVRGCMLHLARLTLPDKTFILQGCLSVWN